MKRLSILILGLILVAASCNTPKTAENIPETPIVSGVVENPPTTESIVPTAPKSEPNSTQTETKSTQVAPESSEVITQPSPEPDQPIQQVEIKPEDKCNNIQGVQEAVPYGYIQDTKGDCSIPLPPGGNAAVNFPPPPVLSDIEKYYFDFVKAPANCASGVYQMELSGKKFSLGCGTGIWEKFLSLGTYNYPLDYLIEHEIKIGEISLNSAFYSSLEIVGRYLHNPQNAYSFTFDIDPTSLGQLDYELFFADVELPFPKSQRIDFTQSYRRFYELNLDQLRTYTGRLEFLKSEKGNFFTPYAFLLWGWQPYEAAE
jgi:hypothetical protein